MCLFIYLRYLWGTLARHPLLNTQQTWPAAEGCAGSSGGAGSDNGLDGPYYGRTEGQRVGGGPRACCRHPTGRVQARSCSQAMWAAVTGKPKCFLWFHVAFWLFKALVLKSWNSEFGGFGVSPFLLPPYLSSSCLFYWEKQKSVPLLFPTFLSFSLLLGLISGTAWPLRKLSIHLF